MPTVSFSFPSHHELLRGGVRQHPVLVERVPGVPLAGIALGRLLLLVMGQAVLLLGLQLRQGDGRLAAAGRAQDQARARVGGVAPKEALEVAEPGQGKKGCSMFIIVLVLGLGG